MLFRSQVTLLTAFPELTAPLPPPPAPQVTLLTAFPELLKAYTDSIDPESTLPRQQPTSIVQSMLRLLESLLAMVVIRIAAGLDDKKAHAAIEAAMLFSLVWGFEASLPPKVMDWYIDWYSLDWTRNPWGSKQCNASTGVPHPCSAPHPGGRGACVRN